ncbi:MAG: hypothetical protein HZB87_01120 [Desulfatitalea sp.]|nr:hypothetical protein [Desulfatitalea sp.]
MAGHLFPERVVDRGRIDGTFGNAPVVSIANDVGQGTLEFVDDGRTLDLTTILKRMDTCPRGFLNKGHQGIGLRGIDLLRIAFGAAKGDEPIQGLFDIVGNNRRVGGGL